MKQKPVWRVNSGNGVPSDLGGFVLYEGAAKSEKVQGYHFNHNDKWLIKNYMDISAYQTTRTRPAKYERVECHICDDDGLYCNTCNGKGYRLEHI